MEGEETIEQLQLEETIKENFASLSDLTNSNWVFLPGLARKLENTGGSGKSTQCLAQM